MGSRLFPTPKTLYVLDADRGLLTPLDPVTLAPQGQAHSVATDVSPENAIVDRDGRLWLLDQHSGDLAWFTAHEKHSIERTGPARLAVADGHPVLVDLSTREATLLDPATGSPLESIRADVRPGDTVAVAGSPGERRILITIASRGLLVTCTFGTGCAAPVPLGSGKADLGAAVEVSNHAVVPDYSTGRVWIVNLATMRVVVEPQLFPGPVRFELLNRDGIVFYNDPDGDQAGVLNLDGTQRAVSKYNPTKPDAGANQVAFESPKTSRPSPPTPRSGPADALPPVNGTGRLENTQPPVVGAPMADIVVRPGTKGVVGQEFELEVVARSTIGIATARWTFGDGSEATGLSVRHKWDRPGEFRVEVAPMLAIGLPARVATATVLIESVDAPPRIDSITISPGAPQVGEPVRFSADVSGQSDRWEWTVQRAGGSVVASSRQREFQHTFATVGTYNVTLVVMAGALRVAQSRTFTVAPEPRAARCGDVLTTNAVLTSDLVCADEVALTIAADNVTLDLRGHLLTAESFNPNSIGIKVAKQGTIKNVAIKNGKVTQFNKPIELTDAASVQITGMVTETSAVDGIVPATGSDIAGQRARSVTITGTRMEGFIGFDFEDHSQVAISGSTIGKGEPRVNDKPTGRSTCQLDSSCSITNSTVLQETVHCNDLSTSTSIEIRDSTVDLHDAGYGCAHLTLVNNRGHIEQIVAQQTLQMLGNTMSHSHAKPLEVHAQGTLFIKGNTFTKMSIGLDIHNGRGAVTENSFIDNTQAGLQFHEGDGHLEISKNTFFQNGYGVDPDMLQFTNAGGLVAEVAPSRGLARRPVTISGNSVERLYHYAYCTLPETTTDGGGNKSLPADPSYCVGVACSQ